MPDRPSDEKMIGELLALLAHDLRNPLSALQSNVGYLRALPAADDPDTSEALDDGLISCDGLSHIIDNIDLLGRMLRAAKADTEHVDLRRTAEQVVARAQMAAESHGLALTLADETRAERVSVSCTMELASLALDNLVRNAIQHGGSGATVRVSVAQNGGFGVALVEDPGPAVAVELRERVFTAEGQLESKSAQSGRYSRGLGLYCAGLAARSCGGSVGVVEPPAGTGNAFELRLPLA